MKISVTILGFVLLATTGYLAISLNKVNLGLKNTNTKLEQKIIKLKEIKEKLTLCETTCKDPICHAGADYQGDIRYIDCGESFTKRWATCLCTTMCLEDFTITVTNRERCRIWPSVGIQIRPEPDEEDEDEEKEHEEDW